MVFLIVGPAVARDEMIGIWHYDYGFDMCYGDLSEVYLTCFYQSTLSTSYVDITADDISGGGTGTRDDIVVCWRTGLWIYSMDDRSWKNVTLPSTQKGGHR